MHRRSPLPPSLWLRRCLAIAILVGLFPGGSEAALFYQVEKVLRLTDLNANADGSIPMSVTGLNAAGRLTGYFPSANGNKLHAFVWDNATKVFTDLNDLLAADSSMATCLNEAGTVAGIFWSADGSYAQRGFVYTTDGAIRTFAAADGGGGDVSAVTAINATGSVTGTYTATGGTTRAFIFQPSTVPPAVQDLGDLGYASNIYQTYVWAQAVNDFDQVIGTAYLLPRQPGRRTLIQGFLWDGGLSLVDASALANAWQNIALNNDGLVVGLYGLGDPDDPFSSVGSFFWDGASVTDLGNLGGGHGASAFAMTDGGPAFGTSTGSDGVLHLFSWNRDRLGGIGGIDDLGSASLFEGDASFLPQSVASPTVVKLDPVFNRPGVYDVAGFGQDAAGNTRSLLWSGGSIHGVVDLMPAYLSFTTISSDYGSKVLINRAEQIACAGTDAQGRQMALLLSVDPDTDDDGLPDSWENRYFGHLGVDLNAPTPSGSGLTNWQAYQQGTDPNDYYQGQNPVIALLNGNEQTGARNSFVPGPLVVSVADAGGHPLIDAPVTFTVGLGNGQMQKSSNSTPGASITVLTDYNGQAKAFFRLPDAASHTSLIVVTPRGGSYSATATFTEYSDGGGGSYDSPFNPSHVVATMNSDGSGDVTWTNNADPTDLEPIDIMYKDRHGQWQVLANVPATTTSYHIPAP